MSNSFPFFAIAQKRNMPYWAVLKILEEVEEELSLWQDDKGAWGDIARAELVERERRREVEQQTQIGDCNLTGTVMTVR